MRKMLYSEGAILFVCVADELQTFPDVLPHWLKVILPVIGALAILIKVRKNLKPEQKS